MRSDNQTFVTASQQANIKYANAVELFFGSGPLRMWSGYGTITIDGNQYLGANGHGEITATGETGDLSAQGRTLTLNGVPSSLVNQVQTEQYKNRLAKEFVILFDQAGNYMTHDCVYVGRMDTLTIQDSGDTCTIGISLENHFLDLSRMRVKRYTQQQLNVDNGDSSDYGLQYIIGIQSVNIPWGKSYFSAPSYMAPEKGPYGL